ncbi:MAG: amidohydrolase family protein [Acidobacteriota bacterium]
MKPVNRRHFMKGSLVAAASAPFLQGTAGATVQTALTTGPHRIIDTHVYLSRWPGRRLPGDEPKALVASLRQQQVAQGWTGSFDALLHKDVGAVNYRLAEECARHGEGLLLPFGTVNPTLPDWEEDLRRCHEEFHMPGIRLHPNYHHYDLEDPEFSRLLRLAQERKLLVQIVAWMEDERVQIQGLQTPLVNLHPLAALLEGLPEARVMVLNGFISLGSVRLPWQRFRKLKNFAFDLAMLEQLMGLRVLIDAVGVDHVAFGSYSPMFYFESALLKLRESDLSPAESAVVLNGNAQRLLSRS